MAIMNLDPKVGDLVYPAFCPQRAGKIIEITKPGTRVRYVTVKMANGEKYMHINSGLKDFRDLALEHRRKADKFDGIVRELEHL